MLLIQQAVPHMRRKKWGRIISIGSVQESNPTDMLVYSASKAAQTLMVKSWQLAKDGITINNGQVVIRWEYWALSDPEYANKVLDGIPMNFPGKRRIAQVLSSCYALKKGGISRDRTYLWTAVRAVAGFASIFNM